MEINLLDVYPKIRRDYDRRAQDKTPEIVRIAKQFGREFFDGERKYGYGGYVYDGRWKTVVKRFADYYKLTRESSILDIGCAKGFMLHDFRELLGGKCRVAGVDVSAYALDNALESVKPFLSLASGEKLPYPDKSFDLVISINSIHNLSLERLKNALREITRVSRDPRKCYITVDAWRTDLERENLEKWVLTAETMMHVDDWKKMFKEVGYKGDYWWFIAE